MKPQESPFVSGKPAIEKAGVLGASGKREAAEGVVYFVRARSGRHVKIGWSTDLPSRLSALQTAHAVPVKVLATVPGVRALESTLHERFRADRVRGEWFNLSDQIRAFIREAGGPTLAPWERIKNTPDVGMDELRQMMVAAERSIWE